MQWAIPGRLAANCRGHAERIAWLKELPRFLETIARRLSITACVPLATEEASCAWLGVVTLGDGTSAVLKAALPHMEGEHEIRGLRFWNGDGTVQVIDADESVGVMLLEHCRPGTNLRTLKEAQQDEVISALLRRLWQRQPPPGEFRPLSQMLEYWSRETAAQAEHWSDAGIVREGLGLFNDLPRTAPSEALLATDLHAGNVLRAEREPWLAIDPKPFSGDPAYDATQHLLNCRSRLRVDATATIRRMADLIEVDEERVRLWLFARLAAEPRNDWSNGDSIVLARAIAP
jgi:streptomycin 6-kinase